MPFKTKIKLSRVNNLSDARFAAAVGIDYIGFCFEPAHAAYIAPIKAKEIMDWLTGSNLVAEFGSQELAVIKDISELLNVDAVEIENDILPDELPAIGRAIIKKIDVNQHTQEEIEKIIQAYQPYCDAFHFYASSTPEKYDCEGLVNLCKQVKVIWGLAFDEHNVLNIIESFEPYAIHIEGGDEERAGVRDFEALNNLLEVLTIEE